MGESYCCEKLSVAKQSFPKGALSECGINRLVMHRADKIFVGGICICRFPLLPLHLLAQQVLHATELKYYDGLEFERRKKSYLLGRYAAKKAISVLSDIKPHDVNIEYGVFNYPIISSSCGLDKVEISISHSSEMGAAIAYPATHPMGIDIERIDPSRTSVIEKELTPREICLLKELDGSKEQGFLMTLAWTIKESLSKVLKTGMMTSFRVYEIMDIISYETSYISYYKYFGQYKTVSIKIEDYICSITCPLKTVLEIKLLG